MVPNYLFVLTLAVAVSARTATKDIYEEPRSSHDTILGDLKYAYETYRDCSGNDMSSCLKLKLAKSLNRISKSDEVSLLSGVKITKNGDAVQHVETDEAIPRGLDESSLDNLIMDKIVGFMQTHTIQVNINYTYNSS